MELIGLNQVLIILCTVSKTLNFNLDPRIPVIKYGEEGSYFGFSVAQHQIFDTVRNAPAEQVLLVGAPKAQTTQPGTNRSGAVYRCGFNSNRRDCVPLYIDQKSRPPAKDELKDGQWLGVTLASHGPGGYVMACAHRYVRKGRDFRWGNGICYSLTQELKLHMPWEPCKNRDVSKAHEQFGFCQAGTSGTISQDNKIVIGTPGPFTWRGTVFTNSISFGLRDDKSWYMTPVQDESSPVDKYSYLGMSVTTGKFFPNKKSSYVAGAPRANGTGQVIFFSKDPSGGFISVDLILNGDMFASSYGYSSGSADLNDDGYLDLIVGAPFYHKKDTGGAIYIYMNSKQGIKADTKPLFLSGKRESRFGLAIEPTGDLNKDNYIDLAIGAPYEESGVVYIYSGGKNGINVIPSQIIKATDLPGPVMSTFGYSLSGGIDYDENGYPDLLVGAFNADRAVVLRTRPVINIETSVTGNYKRIDPHQGCDEDLSEETCFSFTTCFDFKPTVMRTMSRSKVTIMSYIEAETFNGKEFSRVVFKESKFTDRPHIVEKTIPIQSSKKGSCKKYVVYLQDKTDILTPINFKLSYSLVQDEPKMPLSGRSLPDINQYPILNQIMASKIFSANFRKECGEDDICESDLRLRVNLNLLKGDDGIFNLSMGNNTIRMETLIENRKDPAYDTKLYIHYPANMNYKGTISKDKSIQCIENDGVITCLLGNPFKATKRRALGIAFIFDPEGLSDRENVARFKVQLNTSSEEISPEGPVEMDVRIIRKAEVILSGDSNPPEVFYGGEIKGASAMKVEDDIGPMVQHSYKIENNGPMDISKLDVLIDWPYEVPSNYEHGKYALYVLEKPYVESGGDCFVDDKYINPEQIPSSLELTTEDTTFEFPDYTTVASVEPITARSRHRKNEQDIGYNNKDDDDTPKRRRKRELVLPPEDVNIKGKYYKVIKIDCRDNRAKCFTIRCEIYNVNAKNQTWSIKIRSRLWDSTFTEDYPDVNWIEITSRGRILFDEGLDITQDVTNDNFAIVTKVTPDVSKFKDQSTKDVPIWIIVVAVLAGILLLAIVIIILVKCGFFKRRKPTYILAPTSEKPNEF